MGKYSRKNKIKINVFNHHDDKKKYYQDIELIYVLEGSLDIIFDNQSISLKDDDVFIVNSNRIHTIKTSENVLYTQILIAYELVSDVLKSTEFMFWCDSTASKNDEIEEIRNVIKNLLNHYLHGKEDMQSFRYISLCYKLMDILSMNFLVRSIDREINSNQDKYEERNNRINDYVLTNYNQDINIQELSNKLYLSEAYLSRYFKKTYGVNFSKYVASIRLYHAIDELLFTKTPINQIAYDNGFATVSAFNKAFKETYNETPSQIRKKSNDNHNSESGVDINVNEKLELYLSNQQSRNLTDTAISNNIEASHLVNETSLLDKKFNQLINIGPAQDLLRAEVQDHILMLHEELGFSYVRFWSLFTEEMFIDIKNTNGLYNFSRIDIILDFLVKNNLKPHIELANKAKQIVSSVQNVVELKEGESIANSSEWIMLIEAFAKHVTKRYGRNIVDLWNIELWCDVKIIENSDTYYIYFDRFNDIYNTIRKYSKGVKIGGCGFQVGYTMNLNEGFIREWSQQQCSPDFISIMNYAYLRGEINQAKYSIRDTDDSCLLHAIEKIKEICVNTTITPHIYVSEWNLSVSDRNVINDTTFKGAYVVKNIIETYGLVDSVGYFAGSDCVSQHYDSHSLLFGGNGLITTNSIYKPAAYAYKFINQLYSYLVARGENYLITSDNHNSYSIILHNVKRLNYSYYYSEEDKLDKQQVWKYFDDLNNLNIILNLQNIENGKYQIKQRLINDTFGSVLDLWKEMDFYDDLSLNDIDYIKRSVNPKLVINKTEVSNSVLHLDLSLCANEISLVKIYKI